jgi:hypothetical protein
MQENIKFYILAIFIFLQQATSSSDVSKPVVSNKQFRKETLKAQTKEMEGDAQKRLKKRAQGRVIQDTSQVAVEASDKISMYMSKLPLSVQQHSASTAIAIINKVVWGAGTAVRALGRRQEAIQSVLSTNEQILEAATKTYENIQKLTDTLEGLLHPKTIIEAVKDLPSSNISKKDKILNLLKPQNYINTFDKFTDNLYITTNKADQWETVKTTAKSIIEEEKRFDDYMAILQIKVLEKQLMNLHKLENFHSTKDPKTKQQTANPGYKAKLENDISTIEQAITATELKERALSGIQPSSGGLMNKLKKTMGKDEKAQQEKELAKLRDALSQYHKQKSDIETELGQFQSMSTDSIDEDRKKLIEEIEQIKRSNTAKLNPEELVDQINDLKKEIANLKTQFENLKGQDQTTLAPSNDGKKSKEAKKG